MEAITNQRFEVAIRVPHNLRDPRGIDYTHLPHPLTYEEGDKETGLTLVDAWAQLLVR